MVVVVDVNICYCTVRVVYFIILFFLLYYWILMLFSHLWVPLVVQSCRFFIGVLVTLVVYRFIQDMYIRCIILISLPAYSSLFLYFFTLRHLRCLSSSIQISDVLLQPPLYVGHSSLFFLPFPSPCDVSSYSLLIRWFSPSLPLLSLCAGGSIVLPLYFLPLRGASNLVFHIFIEC